MVLFDEFLVADAAWDIRGMVKALPLQGEDLADGVSKILSLFADPPKNSEDEKITFPPS